MSSDMLIASNSWKIALYIIYFMTQLDTHQRYFTLLERDKFCLISIVHPSFAFLCFLYFFVLFFRHRGCDGQKVRFLYPNVAVYLRCSLWSNLCNNSTPILFFMRMFLIDPILIDHVRHSLAKKRSCTGEISLQWL